MDQRKTVLLADAGEEFRTLLWEEMEKTGEFSVEIARDGNEILKRVKERMPDLLVMDVMLPGMDGISVLRQLQKQGDAPMTILSPALSPTGCWRRRQNWGRRIFCRSLLKRPHCWIRCGVCFSKRPRRAYPV